MAFDEGEAVLKVGPWGAENVQEIRALRLYAGRGACRLLEADEDVGAALLERVRPGRRLRDVVTDDDAATRIAAGLMQRLWIPAGEIADTRGLRPLASWFTRAFARHRAEYGGAGPFAPGLFEAAERIAGELLASAPCEVLLHADLHHENILTGEREPWLAIDPKGMLGDPGYEVGPFLLNPDPQASPPKDGPRLHRRLDLFAEALAYDRERLRLWGVVHAVLSACWSAEDGGSGWQNAITAAERLLER
ncbi:MAG: aminoglycoside resistance protein [Chloroflexi bacterium]|nr:aminoglycoside resistance protein [Chloroflexota bacterium]